MTGVCITLLYATWIQCVISTGADDAMCGRVQDFKPIYTMSLDIACDDNLDKLYPKRVSENPERVEK